MVEAILSSERVRATSSPAIREVDGQTAISIKEAAREILTFWGVKVEKDSMWIEPICADRKSHSKITDWKIGFYDQRVHGKEREVLYSVLTQSDRTKKQRLEIEQQAQKDEVEYLCQKYLGQSVDALQLRFKPIAPNSSQILIERSVTLPAFSRMIQKYISHDQIIPDSGSWSLAEFRLIITKQEIDTQTALTHLTKAQGSKKKATASYINRETGAGRSFSWSFAKRAAVLSRAEADLAQSKARAQSGEGRFSGILARSQQVLLYPKKVFSGAMAVARGTIGAVAYDYNPLRPLLGSALSRLWNTSISRTDAETNEVKSMSLQSISEGVMKRLMIDPITGEGQAVQIGEEQKRAAMVAAIELAVKMNILPQFLASLPAFQSYNLGPGDIWSFFRALNMARGTPGSIRSFIHNINQAESQGEKIKLTAAAVASAPFFLIAEKLFPTLSVGPLKNLNLMVVADIAVMKVLGAFQIHMRERGLKGTALLRLLEAIETGITAAFAFDSARNLGESVTNYFETGSVNPIAQIANAQDIISILENNPKYLLGEGGGFPGAIGRFEHEQLEKIAHLFLAENRQTDVDSVDFDKTDEVQSSETAEDHSEADKGPVIRIEEDGIEYLYQAQRQGDSILLLRSYLSSLDIGGQSDQSQTLLEAYQNGSWISLLAEIADPAEPSTPEVFQEWALAFPAENQARDRLVKTDSFEISEGQRPQVVNKGGLEEVLYAVHDYVIFDDASDSIEFRIDLREGESIAQKVDRLLDDSTSAIDDSTGEDLIAHAEQYTGEYVKNLPLRSRELAEISGADRIYETQIRIDLVDRLFSDAEMNGIRFEKSVVRDRFIAFLEQESVIDQSITGSFEYAKLYQFLFQGFAIDEASQSEERPYFLDNPPEPSTQTTTEFTFIIGAGDIFSRIISKYGMIYTESGILNADNQNITDQVTIYKLIGDGETATSTEVEWTQLSDLKVGEKYKLVRQIALEPVPSEPQLVEIPLPSITPIDQPTESEADATQLQDSIFERSLYEQLQDARLQETQSLSDPLFASPYARDASGVIELGAIQAGDSVSKLVLETLGSEYGVGWAQVYQQWAQGKIAIYANSRLLDSDTELGIVDVGEVIKIVDLEGVLNDVPDRTDGEEREDSEDEVTSGTEILADAEPILSGIDFNVTPAPTEIARDSDGLIFLGRIGDAGNSLGIFVNNQLGGILKTVGPSGELINVANPWRRIIEISAMNPEFKLVAVNENGEIGRTFVINPDPNDPNQRNVDIVFPGERIAIIDPHGLAMGITERIVVPEVVDPGFSEEAIEAPTPVPDISQSAVMDAIASQVSEYISENQPDSRISVSVYDPETQTGFGVNETEVYEVSSLMNLAIASLVLQRVDEGIIKLDDRVPGAIRPRNYIPTLEQVLRESVLDSSSSATNDLMTLLSDEASVPAQQQDILTMVQNRFGMNTVQLTVSEESGEATFQGTAQDFISLMVLLEGESLDENSRDFLRDLLDQAADSRLYAHDLEVYPGVSVSEMQALQGPNAHIMRSITTDSGDRLLVVVLGEGQELTQVFTARKEISRAILEGVDSSQVIDNTARIEEAFFLSRSPAAQRDLSAWLFSEEGMRQSFLDQFLSVDELNALKGIPITETTIIVQADGSSEVVFKDTTGQPSVSIWLDAQHEVLNVWGDLPGNRYSFLDLRDVQQDPTHFVGPDYTHLRDSEISVRLTPVQLATPVDWSTIQNRTQIPIEVISQIDGYDFTVVFDPALTRPVLLRSRSIDERDSGLISREMNIGIIAADPNFLSIETNQIALNQIIDQLESTRGISISQIQVEPSSTPVEREDDSAQTLESFSMQLRDRLSEQHIQFSPAMGSVSISDAVVTELVAQSQFKSQDELSAYILSELDAQDLAVKFRELSQAFSQSVTVRGAQPRVGDFSEFKEDFAELLVTKVIADPLNSSITLTHEEWAQLLGYSQAEVTFQGVFPLRSIYVVPGWSLNKSALAQEFGIDPERIAVYSSKDPTVLIVGERVERPDSSAVDTSFQFPTGRLLFQVTTAASRDLLSQGEEVLRTSPTPLDPVEYWQNSALSVISDDARKNEILASFDQ